MSQSVQERPGALDMLAVRNRRCGIEDVAQERDGPLRWILPELATQERARLTNECSGAIASEIRTKGVDRPGQLHDRPRRSQSTHRSAGIVEPLRRDVRSHAGSLSRVPQHHYAQAA